MEMMVEATVAGVDTMIKPWQKASLGVIASMGVYGLVLHDVKQNTSHSNHSTAQQQAIKKQNQIMSAEIQKDKGILSQLIHDLNTIHQQTGDIRHQISLVNQQIQKLKSGIQVATVKVSQIASTVPKFSAPSVSVSPPPLVQTVTRASGA